MQRNPIVTGGFPFGSDFQKSLLLYLTTDYIFASLVIPYLKADYFENEVLVWCFNYIVAYQKKFNAIPSMRILLEETKGLPFQQREIYRLAIETIVESENLAEIEWLKDKVLDFIKRNIFVEAFKRSKDHYNSGLITEAYDNMMTAMDKIHRSTWETVDRTFFFEDFEQRHASRLGSDSESDNIVTGIHELDRILGGGLSLGEAGIWVGYAKRGKTTLLINHGVQGIRRSYKNVLHTVFEGSRGLVSNRYDTIFAQLDYQLVKYGQMDETTFQRLHYEYRMYQRKLVIRAFTERWDYTIEDIYKELKELERLHNWKPDLLIIDYGDLLKGRGKYSTETENQRAAFRDIKMLANRGYAIWTATQGQRPTKDLDTDATVLSSRNIADCYDKVRSGDFIGSINQTREERERKRARLYAELYRDNEAGSVIPIYADFKKMTMHSLRTDNNNSLVVPTRGVQQVKASL
ncbi:MAG: hypothetical protein JW702_09150 [Clostridiales bacterium]|nr:hypothetical protein [Clostridiales bacterium]